MEIGAVVEDVANGAALFSLTSETILCRFPVVRVFLTALSADNFRFRRLMTSMLLLTGGSGAAVKVNTELSATSFSGQNFGDEERRVGRGDAVLGEEAALEVAVEVTLLTVTFKGDIGGEVILVPLRMTIFPIRGGSGLGDLAMISGTNNRLRFSFFFFFFFFGELR